MITNYSELQSAIGDWLNRSDLTTVIPTFIQLCEARVTRRIKTKFKNRLAMTITAANGGAETIPGNRANEIVSLVITSPDEYAGGLKPVSPNLLWDYRRKTRFNTSNPTVATIIDQELLVAPIPDQDYEAELVIEGPLDALSDSNPTNYVLDAAPDVYLYGSLIGSAPYLKEDPRLSVWEKEFEIALHELALERERNEYPNTPVAPLGNVIGSSGDRFSWR